VSTNPTVADALSLLANLVMAWNSMKMQSILDRWNTRRASAVPPELIGCPPRAPKASTCAGVFSFPVEL
jgi:Tn3 transposase DDE domain